MRYVLDTSVILSSGKRAFNSFPNDEVIIPLVVVTELEKKRDDPELGITARSALRYLEEIRSRGDIKKGIELDNGASLRIELNHVDISDLPEALKRYSGNDTRILAVAHALDATLISRDLPLRIKAEVVGVPSRDLTPGDLPKDASSAPAMIYVSDADMATFYETGEIRVDNDLPLHSNVMLSTFSGSSTALAVAEASWRIVRVTDTEVCGIEGKNAQQRYALHHLTDEDVPVVSLGGTAGSGKSLLALAAGMQQVRNGTYNKVVVLRTVHTVLGGELGFLPGDAEEKMAPFSDATFDAMEAFATKREIESMIRNGKLEIIPVSFIRGRTFNNSFIVFDEAQSSEMVTLLTAITRVGRNSKIVLTHDQSQSDNLHVSKHQGVLEVVRRLRGNKLFAHVELERSLRSDVAEAAAEILDDYMF